jgi:hypothetical protein
MKWFHVASMVGGLMTKCGLKPKTYEYKILYSCHHDSYGNFIAKKYDAFLEDVAKHLNEGWLLNGAPFFGGERGTDYMQSMYREKMSDVKNNTLENAVYILQTRLSQVVDCGTCAEYILCGTESQAHTCKKFGSKSKDKLSR